MSHGRRSRVPADLAFGITAAARPGLGPLGAEVERLGYVELWSNDTRRGDGISTLAAIAADTDRLRLALGVVALSDHSPADVVARLEAASVPHDRLVLGVGTGASASLRLVHDGVEELRSRLPGVPLAVAAVGPRMLHLAGEVADAVVATWALPGRVPWIRERLEEGALAAGRPVPRLVLYVRCAIGDGAASRLRHDMERYASYGTHYARAFAAQPDSLVGIAAADGADLRSALGAYLAVADTVVVRPIPADDAVDAWLEVAAAAVGAAT